jgi:geranylgeranyl diphosphate synthase type II
VNTIEQQFQEILQNKKPQNLYDPIEYILMQSGKRLRPAMVRIAADIFDGDPEQVQHVAAAFEMLHNFTLIHDDIMDKADVRRGLPTVYKKWNSNIAILSGDALVALALLELLKTNCPPETVKAITEIFARIGLEICEGQQFDLDFETMETVPIEQYVEMIRLKTAVMFAGCLKSGGLVAGADPESLQALYDLGIHLGLAFQLADDLLDVYADSAHFGKKVGGDIKDNKKTFVYLKALELANDAQKQELKALFSNVPADEQEKFEQVKAIFDAVNVREATEKEIDRYTQMCMEDIRKIHAEEAKKQQLVTLVWNLQRRDK